MIYITLDFELFLGNKTGTVLNSLSIPVDELCRRLDLFNVKMTAFVDAAYLFRLQQISEKYESAKKDLSDVQAIIRRMSENGHYIQMHFHPQWLYSDYDENGWKMDFTHYKMSDMKESELKDSFKGGLDLLQSLSDNKINAFRAGGYSLTTLNNYASFLLENGITIDSSAMPGAFYKSKAQTYDYRHVPSKGIWQFSNDISIEDNAGSLTEIPITTKVVSSIQYLLFKKRIDKQFSKTPTWGDGVGIGESVSLTEQCSRKIKKLVMPCPIPASMDGVMSSSLFNLYEFNRKRNIDIFTILGHPKLFSSSALDNLKDFVSGIINVDSFGVIG